MGNAPVQPSVRRTRRNWYLAAMLLLLMLVLAVWMFSPMRKAFGPWRMASRGTVAPGQSIASWPAPVALTTADAWRGTPPPQPGDYIRETSAYRRWRVTFSSALRLLASRRRTVAAVKALREWQAQFETLAAASARDASAKTPAVSPLFKRPGVKRLIAAPPLPAYEKFYGYQVVLPWNHAVYSYTANAFPPGTPHLLHANGVKDGGIPLRDRPDTNALLVSAGITDPSAKHVLTKVSALEGGFDAVNTWDTGYVSVGFIQFTTGETSEGHSLVQVLERMKSDEAKLARPSSGHYNEFTGYFTDHGIDVRDGRLYVHDPCTDVTRTGADAVKLIIDDKRVTAVFQDAGARSRAFQIAQIRVAYGSYYLTRCPFRIPMAEIREEQVKMQVKAQVSRTAPVASSATTAPGDTVSPASATSVTPPAVVPAPAAVPPPPPPAAVHYVFGSAAVRMALARGGTDEQYRRGKQPSRGGKTHQVVTRLPDLVGTYGDILQTEGGRLTLMDRAVQHGVHDAMESFVQALNSLPQNGPVSKAYLRAHENDLIAALRNRVDVLAQPSAPGTETHGNAVPQSPVAR